MPGILRSKTGYVLVFVILIFVISVAGGVLGDKFGGGFLGAPIAHIQLPAEPLHEEELFSGFKVTNTMLTTWAAILVITTLSFFATRRMNDVPRGLQNFFEAIIEFFMELATSIAGPEKARRFLPLSMTIFIFIVTANFIKEPGLEVNRPDAETATIQDNAAILIAIGANDDVWIDGRRIDVRQVKANVTKLLADNPQGSVVIQADERATADAIIKVMDQSRDAGVYAISLASEPKF